MMALLDFFGVDMLTTRVNGLKLRDSWRQATYDKLELLRALEAGTPPRVDLEHERRLHPLLPRAVASGVIASAHDVAAGGLLVREAGGVVTDADGGEDWLRGGHIVAAGPALQPEIRARVEH